MTGPRLDHVGLNVPDVADAAAFLVEAFGAQEVFHVDRFADPSGVSTERIGAPGDASLEIMMLRIGDGCVELLGWGGPGTGGAGPEHSARPGAAHLSIAVPDVAATLDRLASLPGVDVLGGPCTFTEGPTSGLTNAFCRTPWGLLVELVCWG